MAAPEEAPWTFPRSSASTTTSSSHRTSGRRGCRRSTGSAGPGRVRKRWGSFQQKGGAKYEMPEDPDGHWGDAWVYDDELIYVHKRFVAIPESAVGENAEGLDARPRPSSR